MTNTARIKQGLHPRNAHNLGYDFDLLTSHLPELTPFVINNPAQQKTINFTDSLAVKTLNRALLHAHYGITFWDIPAGYLCPPIPGRVDYIHYLADLLAEDNHNIIPTGKQITALDIGTGANLVYPLTGQHCYGWQFTGTDIDPISIKVAKQLILFNQLKIKLKLQKNQQHIFDGVVSDKDLFTFSMCNPPFHNSLEQAQQGTERKWKNLGKTPSNELNFGGQNAELWCEGGELAFISTMIEESKHVADQIIWFTSLVSKKEHLEALRKLLNKQGVKETKIIDMAQGQKVSRILAWSYFGAAERAEIFEQLA
ncbi:23S rRNA (adenine1618-N6)-methyltransferase [Pseudoalteromonas ulvae UL12]|uniref:Ribosomal RNA large subunit methyltransferase F n=2 Tax=Pseudoalteromonas ulvae TaxID=107327 RepID=A0A244CLQ2_PSEDV|nr:23S rRNA (adenine(1618)-N(6))-methyltransferase RlmF [Pseudoalteromonas ulvae]MBE0365819.1 23S rRNA (adenine1618-N6)-methyltransferase [Pseudoalteromonas ulvae UL12]OUL56515.1 23S rRNA (adenine(1618)-N(6))-methyltransferase [Pseudoalteromonas ulvae]